MRSGQKGKRGERRIVDILNTRFNTQVFARVPSSGAISTFRGTRLSAEATRCLSGDIITIEGFVFSMEIKTGYDLDFVSFFGSKSSADLSEFTAFCKQASDDAERTPGRIPLVVYTKDRRDPVCAVPRDNHSRAEEIGVALRKLGGRHFCIPLQIEGFQKWGDWVIFPLGDFLSGFPDGFFIDSRLGFKKDAE